MGDDCKCTLRVDYMKVSGLFYKQIEHITMGIALNLYVETLSTHLA